ncbi:hypothetical protein ACOSP7_002284 [Xanthoceras sorbifolium]|uniref:Trans-resveratrol di-O-methyltransferase-like n=1 Tax=Xanthoceras sorbifolium TaxID=99658 RepID=A0ABQ8ILI1_9ROSI|nr:hypothetical protein JRO89_XS01G0189900 [Xanthoceras sorbifolium]
MDMINGEKGSSCELLQAQAQVYNCTFNFINSMALKCAVQLGIPDLIINHGLPMTLSQLVTALNILPNKAGSLQRLMRILCYSGFFARQKASEDEQEEEYLLTPASKLLFAKDETLRASPFVMFILDPIMTTPFHFMSTWFQNDDHTVFETAHGKTFWDIAGHEPKFKNVFQEAMSTDSQLISSVVIKDCKGVFKGLNSLVDVGGGKGTMAKAIASAFPHMKCTVFDLPHVVNNLQGTENFEFLGGDMFEAIPYADAILLKWIIHDWGNEESVKILKRCKEAIPSREKGGKVIIIDIVIDELKEDKETILETQLCFDMLMMGLFNTAKERSVEEWKKLFLEAGFTNYKITPILGLRSIIELYP